MLIKIKLFFTVLILAASISLTHAQYTKFFDFSGTATGTGPYGPLLYDGSFLYGMAAFSGSNNVGTLFKIKPDGTDFVKLLDFAETANGALPKSGLVTDGTYLYGVAVEGGIASAGALFRIKPDGTNFTKLKDFNGVTTGHYPQGALFLNGDSLYGATLSQGANGKGTLFKISTDGTGFKKFYDFDGTVSGSGPTGTLIFDGTYFYGMTNRGGVNNMGVIFKIKPDGTSFSKLLDFAGTSNGAVPTGALTYDGTYLYGMTNEGGSSNFGVVFKIKTDGTDFTKLLDFSGTSNGKWPFGSLVAEGNALYGMTSGGGASQLGTLFKILKDGTGYTLLFSFNSTSGKEPLGSLLWQNGFLYGPATSGGANSGGALFKYCTVPVISSQTVTICAGETFTVGNNTYNSTGTFTNKLLTPNGCDSTITTNLTVLPPLTATLAIVPASCGNNDGSASITASGGAGAYNYSWTDGTTTSHVDGLSGSPDTLIVVTTDGHGCARSDTAIVGCTTGIMEEDLPVSLYVSPNPANGSFTIKVHGMQAEAATVRLYNVLGAEIYQTIITNDTSTISPHLSEGIYFICLAAEQRTIGQKIIVRR